MESSIEIPNEIKELENSNEYNSVNFINSILLMNSNKPTFISIANKYINRFIKSKESFEVALSILKTSDLDYTIYFNSINILKNKLKYNFGNYCDDKIKIAELASIVIDSIDRLNSTNKSYILETLAHCLAYLFMFGFKCNEMMFEIILNNFSQKISLNSSSNNSIIVTNYYICYSSFLYNITQILYEDSIVVDKRHMKEYSNVLPNLSNVVLDSINSIIQNQNLINTNDSNAFLSNILLNCINVWMEFGFPDKCLENMCLPEYKSILDFIFAINQKNLIQHKIAICQFISQNHIEPLTNLIVERVVHLKEYVNEAINSKNGDTINFFIDIYETLCISKMNLILNFKAYEIFEIYLNLTKICDKTRIMYSCDFWSLNFIPVILSSNEYSKCPELLSIIDSAIRSIISKAKWSNDIFARLNTEKQSNIKDEEYDDELRVRSAIKEFLIGISRNLFSFKYLYTTYFQKEIINIIGKLKDDLSNVKSWGIFEALIYCIYCFSDTAQKGDIPLIEEILLTAIEVPVDFCQIYRVVTDLIDNLVNILSKNTDLLKTSFQYLAKGLDNDLTRSKFILLRILYNQLVYYNKIK